ncbi:MAG TPA: hypothetical protein VHF45_13440 [Thermoleophilaceae bacterium]|jgi:hypothetical protein|nr:hypothetical protein [Thermoleophilaceae bacterium]
MAPKRNEDRGVETEASVLDRSAVLDLQADERALPGLLVTTTEWAVSDPLRPERLRPDREAAGLPMPILLFHGTDDHTVPELLVGRVRPRAARARDLPPRRGRRACRVLELGPAHFERRGRAFLARVLG